VVATADPGSQEAVSSHGISNSSILFHRETYKPLLFHRFHGFFDRGLGRDGHAIVDHDVFRGQRGQIFADFQGVKHIALAAESTI
jgi:hypothetical protein